MIILSLLFASVVSVSGFSPGFQPPSCGIGAETAGGGVRAFSMGGVSAGMPDSAMVSGANPSVSAWAVSTAFSWGTKVRDTRDISWSGASAFPDISMIVPMPYNLQFSALLSNRSRINREDSLVFENGSGTIKWTGGSAESYMGLTARVSEHLAFSLGGKCFFGSALGDAVTTPDNPGHQVPVATVYRDDLAFSPAWGAVFGAFMNTDYLAAGLSVVTDRSGSLNIQRDYAGTSSADTTSNYSVPGELYAGLSVRIIPRLAIGLDFYSRKALHLLGKTTEAGSTAASGFEVDAGSGFCIRGGFRAMNGLWRDGAMMYTGGAGYTVSGGKASFDIGASYETWGADQSETVVFASVMASENWLGR
ncbi:hypothetical protein DRQ21_04165 [Candidatus Fermentibacteria bacterium]|nr:MAG: hypothetical protein DRQ21_04165 [Candidatus Fermentibacteria bacterium]